ncbi:MAG: ABC transporter permease [Gemmatimonadota bacterium]|jgi:predicted permease
MGTLVTDLRNAFRSLKKSPGFAAVVVFTLALGIGANVAMFSVVNAVLMEGLPFPEADRLILGRTTYEGELSWNVSSEDYYDYRDQVRAFETLGVIRTFAGEETVTGGEEPERVASTMVSVNLFRALGVGPQEGRDFNQEDGELSAPGVVLISHGYWQRRFGGEPEAVGRSITVAGTPVTVIGVMPPDFFFFQNVDIWLPMRPGGPWTGVRRYHNWTVVGRLAPGVSIEQAQAQVDVVAAQLQEAYPESNAEKGLAVLPLKDVLVDQYDEMLLTLMAAIGLVLLIACGNVAGLLLARGLGRTRELSVRAALGASQGHILRQLLGESLLLAVAAGVIGTVLALWLQGMAVGVLPLDYVGITEIGLSGPMLGFALLLSLVTALVFGAIPAWTGARTNPGENLTSGTRTTESGSGARMRSGLVVLQVALSLILLIGSGLLVRSFIRLQGVDPGFRTEALLTAQVGIPASDYDAEERVAFFDGLLEDIRNLPSVRGAGAISQLPIKDGYSNVGAWDPENPPPGPRDRTLAEHRRVAPGYFDVMDIPILAGRDFLDLGTPESEFVLIVNETMARGLFGDQNPLGRMVAVDTGEEQPALARVVGLVGDVRMTGLAREPQWQMYYSLGQVPSTGMSLAIRTAGNPAAVVNEVRQVLRNRDPDIPLGNVATMDEVFQDAVATPRILMTSLSAFALVALFLSVLGLYSVLAFYVVWRMHEIGIRVAMGATGGRVLGLVLRRGLTLVVGGLVLGLVGALILTRYLQEQLYQVGTTDSLTFGGVSVGLLLVAILACLIPGWRAVRVDPVKALQVE